MSVSVHYHAMLKSAVSSNYISVSTWHHWGKLMMIFPKAETYSKW